MSTRRFELRRLKAAVSIAQVLADRGRLERMRRRGRQLVGPCPIHDGDNVNAFVVDPQRNIWRCFTRCDTGGDIVELVRRWDGTGYGSVAAYLAALPAATTHLAPLAARTALSNSRFRPFTRTLSLEPDTPFLRRKGIRAATARRYEAGAYTGRGMLDGCVAVRLHDCHGTPLGYAGRRLDPDRARRLGKWVFPPALPRDSLLYGYHHAIAMSTTDVVVVECTWGVMRLMQLGRPAVALLGCHLSTRQTQLLQAFHSVVLLMDGDAAGRTAASRIQQTLQRAVVGELPDCKDPDELDDDELTSILDSSR